MTRSGIAALLIAVVGAWNSQPAQASPPIALVPKPLRVEWAAGKFVLTPRTIILADKDSADAANVARQLAKRLCRATGFKLAVTPYDGRNSTRNAILLTTKDAPAARAGRIFAQRDGQRRDDRRR